MLLTTLFGSAVMSLLVLSAPTSAPPDGNARVVPDLAAGSTTAGSTTGGSTTADSIEEDARRVLAYLDREFPGPRLEDSLHHEIGDVTCDGIPDHVLGWIDPSDRMDPLYRVLIARVFDGRVEAEKLALPLFQLGREMCPPAPLPMITVEMRVEPMIDIVQHSYRLPPECTMMVSIEDSTCGFLILAWDPAAAPGDQLLMVTGE